MKRVLGRLGTSYGTACLAQVPFELPPPLCQARPARLAPCRPSFPGGATQPEAAAAAAVGKAPVCGRRLLPRCGPRRLHRAPSSVRAGLRTAAERTGRLSCPVLATWTLRTTPVVWLLYKDDSLLFTA